MLPQLLQLSQLFFSTDLPDIMIVAVRSISQHLELCQKPLQNLKLSGRRPTLDCKLPAGGRPCGGVGGAFTGAREAASGGATRSAVPSSSSTPDKHGVQTLQVLPSRGYLAGVARGGGGTTKFPVSLGGVGSHGGLHR